MELNITFAGICCNFHDFIAGVPMRTVLPDALSVRFGTIWIPGQDEQFHKAEYYLLPHLAFIRDQVSGGMGTVLNGRYLRILNPKDKSLDWEGGGFSLTTFVEDFRPSNDVVLGGNAAAYFDITGGCAWTEGTGIEPRITRVRMETDGTPILSISPLPGSLPDAIDGEHAIETQQLFVTNLDYDPAAEDQKFDFLMNYLVADGGIPKVLKHPTPGLPEEPKALTLLSLGQKLKALGELIETDNGTVSGYHARGGRIDPRFCALPPKAKSPRSRSSFVPVSHFGGSSSVMVQDPVPLDQSCSDSHYP